MVEQKYNPRTSCNFPYFFEIFKTKDTVFRTFQRGHVVDASCMKRRKIRGPRMAKARFRRETFQQLNFIRI